MNEPYEFMVHLSTLAVTLYPHFIFYWQTENPRRPKCGAFTAVSIFLRNNIPDDFLDALVPLAQAFGFETNSQWLYLRFVDGLTLMDIIATSADEPNILCRCHVIHADAVKLGRLCCEMMEYAKAHLDSFKALKKLDGEIRPLTDGKATFIQRADEIKLQLPEACIESALIAAFMLAERQERKGGYIPDRR